MAEDKSIVDYSQVVLEVKNLKKYFKVGVGKNKLIVPAVDDVTFNVYKREVFGLVGESGSGKTTTGRTIIKLYNPTEGYVKLNDIAIAAGYANHVQNIKKIKEKLKLDILLLDPSNVEKNNLKKQANEKITNIQYKLDAIPSARKDAMRKANKPIEDYKMALYDLKTKFTLDAESVTFKYNMDKDDVLASTHNKALVEMNHELDTVKLNFDRKVDGLKDSAALQKEEIEKRIEDLRVTYEADVARLNDTFKDRIKDAEKDVISKADAKAKVKVLTDAKNEAISKIKETFFDAKTKVSQPDKAAVNIAKKAVKDKYNAERKELKDQIKAIKAELKANIAQVKSSDFTPEEKLQMKQLADEIRIKAEDAIKVEKLRIEEVKRINRSKETLQTSRKMQMIFQDPISSLNPRMTVREIIGEGLTIQGEKTQDEISKLVEEVLEIVGLAPEYATRYPHEFSGGQRQRIGIARALIMNPNFIIADEPISALDVSIRAQVLNLLTNLREKLGLTMLFIAHDLSVVRFFCDRIAVMHNGKIVEIASSEELFANPMHDYTISLLSAIPQPDPDYEKGRQRIHYNPMNHDYRDDKPSLKEISEGHFVYANDKEFETMKKNYGKVNKDLKK